MVVNIDSVLSFSKTVLNWGGGGLSWER